MKKWKLLSLLMLIIVLPLVSAIDECQQKQLVKNTPCNIITSWNYPNQCNTYTIVYYQENGSLTGSATLGNYAETSFCNVTFNFTQPGLYTYNISSGDTGSLTVAKSEEEMASLSILLFVMIITGIFFLIPFLNMRYNKNLAVDKLLRGLSLTMGVFLLMLDSSIVATIASNAGIDVTTSIFTFMNIIRWLSYPLMVIILMLTFKMVRTTIEEQKRMVRMGENDK